MRVLVACEESQAVTREMRRLGHEAYSCDSVKPSGGQPEWHIQGDALEAIKGGVVETMDGADHYVGKWDMLIAHPPCTYLTCTGNKWFKPEYRDRFPTRENDRRKAVAFFMAFANADCERIAIENPVGIMSTAWRKPDQIIHPWMFGDPYEKRTCLWLNGLPKLAMDNPVKPEPRTQFASGKSMPKWYVDASRLSTSERAKARSKTFPGIARAIAEQWAGNAEKEDE